MAKLFLILSAFLEAFALGLSLASPGSRGQLHHVRRFENTTTTNSTWGQGVHTTCQIGVGSCSRANGIIWPNTTSQTTVHIASTAIVTTTPTWRFGTGSTPGITSVGNITAKVTTTTVVEIQTVVSSVLFGTTMFLEYQAVEYQSVEHQAEFQVEYQIEYRIEYQSIDCFSGLNSLSQVN
ncbi:hypothetical protein CSHISOI_09140 [Colletotrichum shisoi]|uniref:Uncharacterized protein n=1 Tax=Colletotrichum shisoi TaxID=2078593 RepID=A0A5Q4BHA7_9PEZI|nr:hypothetical protein CSHISOI_09140 [Colletotrichum shisoi]